MKKGEEKLFSKKAHFFRNPSPFFQFLSFFLFPLEKSDHQVSEICPENFAAVTRKARSFSNRSFSSDDYLSTYQCR